MNQWILLLNWLHGGVGALLSEAEPNAAQRRCQLFLLQLARDTLSRMAPWSPSGGEIRGHMRLDASGYTSHGHVLPLGASAGVPDIAATCDVEDVLRGYDPHLADIACQPDLVLKLVELWPSLRRPCQR